MRVKGGLHAGKILHGTAVVYVTNSVLRALVQIRQDSCKVNLQ